MGIIHSNKYSGFSTAHLYSDPDLANAGISNPHIGIVGPIWDYSYNTANNYELYHVDSTPDYKKVDVDLADQEAIGSSTEFRRHKSHISPTGSPYLYNSGDTFTELKPIKTHWAWRNGEYGHGSYYRNHNTAFLGLLHKYCGNQSMAHNNLEEPGIPTDQWLKLEQYISPHWMLGFSLAQSGTYVVAGTPHACGSGSTTTTEPDGIGGLRQCFVNGPYLHYDPDKHNKMMQKIGVGNTEIGNIRFTYPKDGVLSVEYNTLFNNKSKEWSKVVRTSYASTSATATGSRIQRTERAPSNQCNNNIFGPYYPSSQYEPFTILNDIAGWVPLSTTSSHPNYFDKAWPEAGAAILPPSINPVTRTDGTVDETQHFRKQRWGPQGESWSASNAQFTGFHTDISGNYQAEFGYSVDMSDGFIIAGAPGYYGGVNSERVDRGAIGVYIQNPEGSGNDHFKVYGGDSHHATLNWLPYTRREGEYPGDRFGHAVACGYNRYIVGAPGFNGGQGKAYLYADVWREHEAGPWADVLPENDPTLHHGTWIFSRPLTSTMETASGISTGDSFCKFGQRLYGLKLIKELTPVGVGQSYGYSVSVGNGRIAVGNLAGAGSVEIFNLEGNRIGILTAPDGQTGDCFGRSVEINQGIIAVGAPHATVGIGTTNVRCGAVYAFDRNRVSSIHQIWRGRNRDSEGNPIRPGFLWKQHPPDGSDGDRFGDSLCIGSGRVLVGAPYKSHFSTPSADGSAYNLNLHGNVINVLTAASWKERNGEPGPGIRTDSHFGHAVSISGHHAVISAPFHGEWIEGSAHANQYGWPTDKNIVHPAVPDTLYFFTTPQCLTVWDTIDNNHGKH